MSTTLTTEDCMNVLVCYAERKGLRPNKTFSEAKLKIAEIIGLTNTSGTTGVWFDKAKGKWCAEIMFKSKKYYLGRYNKKEDAIAVKKIAEKEIFGDFLKWYAETYPEKWEQMQKTRGKD